MSEDFATLEITPRELEKITGKDVSEGFVGGILGGVYRPSSIRQFSGRLGLIAIELIVAGLVFVFSLPIGLSLIRKSTAGGLRVFIIALIITTIVMAIWNLFMQSQLKTLKRLMLLLDEVDHFNRMIQTLTLLDQFGEDAIGERQALFIALSLTRENLVMAMTTEKLLRENQRLLDQQASFLSHLETNLVTLKTIEMDHQAQEYRRVLNEALTINLAVQQQMSELPHQS
jgi:hypothetical protein